jgi:hypothetical protein
MSLVWVPEQPFDALLVTVKMARLSWLPRRVEMSRYRTFLVSTGTAPFARQRLCVEKGESIGTSKGEPA